MPRDKIGLDNHMLKALAKFITPFLFGLTLINVAHGKTCSPKDAEAADAMIDHLDSWEKVDSAFKRYAQCDDGSIAEGNSEAVARILIDQWNTLSALARLIKINPPLKRFVLRHIDSTLNTDDLVKIKALASSSCQKDLTVLCAELKRSATDAAK